MGNKLDKLTRTVSGRSLQNENHSEEETKIENSNPHQKNTVENTKIRSSSAFNDNLSSIDTENAIKTQKINRNLQPSINVTNNNQSSSPINATGMFIQRQSIQNRRASDHKKLLSPRNTLKLDTTPFLSPTSVSPISPSLSKNIYLIAEKINLSTLPKWLYRIIHLSNNQTLSQLYSEVKNAQKHRIMSPQLSYLYSTSVALQPKNLKKNRYTDILPFDKNRVILDTSRFPISPNDSNRTDYINASYINSGNDCRYIATQGPLENTVADFWQMIWQENSRVIVMLASEYESGKHKVFKYWPSQKGDLILRVFTIEYLKGSAMERRRVWHIHFLGWPDYKKTSSRNLLTAINLMNYLNFRVEIEEELNIPSGSLEFLKIQRFGRQGRSLNLRSFLKEVSDESFHDLKIKFGEGVFNLISKKSIEMLLLDDSEQECTKNSAADNFSANGLSSEHSSPSTVEFSNLNKKTNYTSNLRFTSDRHIDPSSKSNDSFAPNSPPVNFEIYSTPMELETFKTPVAANNFMSMNSSNTNISNKSGIENFHSCENTLDYKNNNMEVDDTSYQQDCQQNNISLSNSEAINGLGLEFEKKELRMEPKKQRSQLFQNNASDDEEEQLNRSRNMAKIGPPVIHCSAGCGRTGTLITIDTIETLLTSQAPGAEINRSGNQDMILEIVDLLREQRVNMVQSFEQFCFCYEAILERILEWQESDKSFEWQNL
ncbi:protein tyrosine phosphatase, non-receptor type 12 [Clydaea vesicula]|uniref:Protein tyrosine phosphatase, non-receptor type 12 n=1 Tax=Clydaea vesicula TaxID=447962 RepID=A0AAD5U6I4_9FUNG|nr:protein tyrosine phosphatase, non-receptor type 12 [Clydaea vesicula]